MLHHVQIECNTVAVATVIFLPIFSIISLTVLLFGINTLLVATSFDTVCRRQSTGAAAFVIIAVI